MSDDAISFLMVIAFGITLFATIFLIAGGVWLLNKILDKRGE